MVDESVHQEITNFAKTSRSGTCIKCHCIIRKTKGNFCFIISSLEYFQNLIKTSNDLLILINIVFIIFLSWLKLINKNFLSHSGLNSLLLVAFIHIFCRCLEHASHWMCKKFFELIKLDVDTTCDLKQKNWCN